MISVCVAETDQLWQLALASESTVLAKMKSIARYLTFKGKKKETRKTLHRRKWLMPREWSVSVKRGQSLITVQQHWLKGSVTVALTVMQEQQEHTV